MNVQLENLPNCLTTVRVEIPAEEGAKTWNEIAKEYAQYAKLPGYRPGKAPRAIVEAKFKKEIKEEAQSRLLSNSVRDAVKEHNIRYLSISNVEDLEFGEDKSFRFTATLVTAPTFDLPDYKALSVELPSAEATEQDVDEAFERIRTQHAEFVDITDRAAEADDFAVISYKGTLDGKPVDEAAPGAAKRLSGGDDFWIKLSGDSLLPGFAEKIVGAKIGETREFDLELAADFPGEALAGKTLHYSVTLNGIKQQKLPELDDAFAAKLIEGKTLAEIRDIIRTELGRQKEFEVEQEKRNQILKQLIDKIECELPEGHVRNETHRILTDLVSENRNRGLSDEQIKEGQQELLASAGQAARERLKATFVLLRIGEQENISVSREEFEGRLAAMSARYDIPREKLRKDLEKAGALGKLQEEILTGKVLDFLASNVSVAPKAPEAAEAAQTAEAAPEAAPEVN